MEFRKVLIVVACGVIVGLIIAIIRLLLLGSSAAYYEDTRVNQRGSRKHKKASANIFSGLAEQAAAIYARINCGIIKFAILVNEAAEHNAEAAVKEYEESLGNQRLLYIVQNVKEIGYHEQN